MAVQVECDADRRVAHLSLQVLRVRAAGDHQRGVGVAQIVEAEAGQLRAADGGREDAVAEVVVIQDFTVRQVARWTSSWCPWRKAPEAEKLGRLDKRLPEARAARSAADAQA
ncbi:MAG TPA: hypothetical protein VFM41_09390 [Gaiella sp.]|nr:hypothetical protein [Gaiella sp.]